VQVREAKEQVGPEALDAALAGLGDAGDVARRLDEEAERELGEILSLSSLTAPLALQYLDRLARPIPTLTPATGVAVVTRAYVAHMTVERDPTAYGVETGLTLISLPPLRHARPPQDLLNRVVKASRRRFEPLRHLPAPAWDGFVLALVQRVHSAAAGDEGLLDNPVVDGLARFGWVLRQVDLRYGLEPERPAGRP
jgi:hypothetical protein